MKRRQSIKMIGKTDLLKWLNDILHEGQNEIMNVEILGTGTVYCRVINHYHPGIILEAAIIRQPKNDYEYLSNLRLFQGALGKLKVQRQIDIAKLSKCRYQDNWQLSSWLYRHFLEQPLPIFPPPPLQKRSHTTFHQHKQNFIHNAPVQSPPPPSLPIGKSSVSSELFKSNFQGVIQRAKDILMSRESDTEKVKQLRVLLNVPMREDNLSEISDLLGLEDRDSEDRY